MDIENDPTEMKSLSKAATPEFQRKTICGLIVARCAEVLSKMRLMLVKSPINGITSQAGTNLYVSDFSGLIQIQSPSSIDF